MEYCEKTLADVINEKKLHKTPDRLWNLFRQVDVVLKNCSDVANEDVDTIFSDSRLTALPQVDQQY